MNSKIIGCIIALTLCLCLAVPVFAASEDFTIVNGVLTAYNGAGGDISIPDGVTSIGNAVFYSSSKLTGVTIPATVTHIGDFAFFDCDGLVSIIIPDSVISIGVSIFDGCSNLSDVTISSSLASISISAFARCYSLTSITLPSSITQIEDSAFSQCINLLTVSFPNGLTSIDDYAFAFCRKLESASIPGSVSHIGEYAFHWDDNYDDDGNIIYAGLPHLTIYGVAGSTAETYAKNNNIPFSTGTPGAIPPAPPVPQLPPVALAADGILVILNGKALVFDVPPQNVNGRILVPLRAIFEEIGASIEYDPATQTVTATKDGIVVVLTIGDVSPTVNGVTVPLDQPGIIVDGRTLAPLRFVAEAFGGTVEWDSATQTATITK